MKATKKHRIDMVRIWRVLWVLDLLVFIGVLCWIFSDTITIWKQKQIKPATVIIATVQDEPIDFDAEATSSEEIIAEVSAENVAVLPEEVYSNICDDNFSEWFLANENREITIWKKMDSETGCLLVQLRDKNDMEIVTFLNKDVYAYHLSEENWTKCEKYFSETTTTSITDTAWTAYQEVGAQCGESWNHPNGSTEKCARCKESAQIQVYVILNRCISPLVKQTTIRSVMEAPNQFPHTVDVVKARRVKSSSPYEQLDIEECFKQALLVWAEEGMKVPENVLFAAQFEQGKGVFAQYGKTLYCYV